MLFANLDKNTQRRIVSEMYEKSCVAGDILIQQGDVGLSASQVGLGEGWRLHACRLHLEAHAGARVKLVACSLMLSASCTCLMACSSCLNAMQLYVVKSGKFEVGIELYLPQAMAVGKATAGPQTFCTTHVPHGLPATCSSQCKSMPYQLRLSWHGLLRGQRAGMEAQAGMLLPPSNMQHAHASASSQQPSTPPGAGAPQGRHVQGQHQECRRLLWRDQPHVQLPPLSHCGSYHGCSGVGAGP